MPRPESDVAEDHISTFDEYPVQGIRDFIDFVWKRPECERCDNNEWTIGENRRWRTVGLPTPDENGDLPGPPDAFRRAIVITCAVCGNIRLTSAAVVRRWLDHREAAG